MQRASAPVMRTVIFSNEEDLQHGLPVVIWREWWLQMGIRKWVIGCLNERCMHKCLHSKWCSDRSAGVGKYERTGDGIIVEGFHVQVFVLTVVVAGHGGATGCHTGIVRVAAGLCGVENAYIDKLIVAIMHMNVETTR